MYLDYFALKRHPFRVTPDPSLFFPGGTHGRGVVLDALVYGITTGEGILKVVGEVGSGKTMLCRMLEEKLPPSVEIVYLANPNLSARDIIYAIAFELKLDVDSATDRLVVMHKLQDYLLKRHGEGATVVVFIEEAQSMPLETLEEVRLLSNLETHRHKLMQIVLFGQPELDRKLQNKAIRQLRERITHSFNLEPLNPEEVREYLHFRLRTAGCPWPQLFSPRAEKLLAAASGGLTRRINILADKALLASYADPSTRPEPRNSAGEVLPMILPRHVKIAIADSGYRRFQLPDWLPHAALGTLAGIAIGAFVLIQSGGFGGGDGESIESGAVSAAPEPAAPPVNTSIPDAPVVAPNETNTALSSVPVQAQEAALVAAVQIDDAQAAAVPTDVLPEPTSASTVNVAAIVAPEQASLQQAVAVGAPAATVNDPALVPANGSAEPMQVAMTATVTAAKVEVPASPQAEFAVTTPVNALVEEPAAPYMPAATGLAAQRREPSLAWLATVPQKSGYTIQLFAASTSQPEQLNEFLEFLELTDLLERSYICVISGNASRAEQWLVMHGEFAGVSEVRKYIDSLPPYIAQYQPYARNLDDIACAR